MLDGHPYADIPAIQINTQGVISILHILDLYKAPNLDQIPTRFLKETSNSIAPTLVLVYKAFLEQGEFPMIGKGHSYVVLLNLF